MAANKFYPLDYDAISLILRQGKHNGEHNGVQTELTEDRTALEYFPVTFKTNSDLQDVLVGMNCNPDDWRVASCNHADHAVLDKEMERHSLTYVCAAARTCLSRGRLALYHEVHPAVLGQTIVVMAIADKPDRLPAGIFF